MIKSLLIGIFGVVFLMFGWIIVQSFWRETFSDHITDEDVLAGRSDCMNCGCSTFCEEKLSRIQAK